MNVDVIQGAVIALVSIGGGAGLQSYLYERKERKDRRIQFEHDILLDMQVALGDMAITAERIRFAKRAANSWDDALPELPWADLIKNAVQASRDSVLVDDGDLQKLVTSTKDAFLRLAGAASETEAVAAVPLARDLLRQTNERIGQRVRGL